MVYGYGVKEFVILIPNIAVEEARAIAKKPRKIVEVISINWNKVIYENSHKRS